MKNRVRLPNRHAGPPGPPPPQIWVTPKICSKTFSEIWSKEKKNFLVQNDPKNVSHFRDGLNPAHEI